MSPLSLFIADRHRWNGAVILSTRAICAPIAVGCTVVFKASELCPKTHHCLREAWEEAGIPKGVLNVIQTSRENAPQTTEALIAHPKIRKVEFIGSRAVGKIIGQVCAKHVKPILMELGGKSAAIVLDDADLEQAANLCLLGRKYVHRPSLINAKSQSVCTPWPGLLLHRASLGARDHCSKVRSIAP